MQLELNDQELEALRRVVEHHLDGLVREIAASDTESSR